MMYTKGEVDEVPNSCGIYEGGLDTLHRDNGWYSKVVCYSRSKEDLNAMLDKTAEALNGSLQVVQPNYAAAFNMWMDDYMNAPQAYEDSHDSAVRHLKEKLNGEEPSYGAVCAEVLVNYLNKLEQLALESK